MRFRFRARRPLTYTLLLSVTIALLILLQYRFGVITTLDDIHQALTTQPDTVALRLPTSLLQLDSFFSPHHSDGSIVEDESPKLPVHATDCRMDNCFDFSLCRHGFLVYVYPLAVDLQPSDSYMQIINVIRLSWLYTEDIEKACLFVSGIDTLDRDRLSPDYVHNLQEQLTLLSHWNNGRNHVIFNLYSGTWPDYSELFGVDIGYAMLAKASVSTNKFRAGFDISLPLFHKTLPVKGGEGSRLFNINVPSNRKYLLSFKGKRYLTGIGSVSRNSLYHIHNGRDIILLTTCRHGKDWQKFADSRCAEDNELYDRYDFTDLLANSTFCLVPRGRRLGSFRFLEVLQYGCIPVLLSDNWELPFSEVINWRKAAIWGDESLLYQLPHSLRSMPYTRVAALQQQSQLLWTKYFSSLEKIVITTLEIIKNRVEAHNSLSLGAWNTSPGAYALHPSYSRDLTLFPFYTRTNAMSQFTALLYITEASSSLKTFVDNVAASAHVHTIYLLVVDRNDLMTFVKTISRSQTAVPTHVRLLADLAESYKLYGEFPTDAVLTLYQRDYLVTEEVDFAFSVWKEYPSRLVGHLGRSCIWHNGHERYHYTSRLSYQYSLVLLEMSVVHRYYLAKLSSHIQRLPARVAACTDLLLNFIVSDLTALPPIKVGQRVSFKSVPGELAAHDSCIDSVYSSFGYMPLRQSHVRLDPALFKDKVSRLRKRYPLMERTI